MRDGIIRLKYESSEVVMDGDNLPIKPFVAITCLIVFTAATLGAVCTQIEVVLAYKGGIFGTLMVYILPPLMRTAISERTSSSTSSCLNYGVLAGGPSLSHNNNGSNMDSDNTRNKHLPVKKRDNQYLHFSQEDSTSTSSVITNEMHSKSIDDFIQGNVDIVQNKQNNGNLRTSSRSSSHSNEQSENQLLSIIKIMFTKPEHWKCAFIFTWGFGSGILSVCVTILKQAGVLNS